MWWWKCKGNKWSKIVSIWGELSQGSRHTIAQCDNCDGYRLPKGKKSIIAGSKVINWQLSEEYNLSNTVRPPWAGSNSCRPSCPGEEEFSSFHFCLRFYPESTLLLLLLFYSNILSDYFQGTKFLIHLI